MFLRALVVAPASAGLPWVLLLGVGGCVAVIVEQLQRMVGSSAASAVTRAQAGSRPAARDAAQDAVSSQLPAAVASQGVRTSTARVTERRVGVAGSAVDSALQPASPTLAATTSQAPLRIREEDVDPVMAVDLQFDCPSGAVNPAAVQRFGGYRRQVAMSPPSDEGRDTKGVMCTEAELEEAVQHAVEAALLDSNVKLKLQANINTLLIVTGVVFFWRGTWTLLDGTLGDSAANAALCCVAGLALVFGIRALKLPTASTFNEDL